MAETRKATLSQQINFLRTASENGIDAAVDISGAVLAVDASGAVGMSIVSRILPGGHLEL